MSKGSEMVPDLSGMVPDHSQKLFEHLCIQTKCCVRERKIEMPNTHEVSGPENHFALGNNRNHGDTHRHDVNFDGPDSSPSLIWTAFAKKIDIRGPSRAQMHGASRAQKNGCPGPSLTTDLTSFLDA